MEKLILLAVIVHLYCGVDSTDSNNLTLSTRNNNTPVMLQNNVSNTGGAVDTVHLGENDFSQVMNQCNETYQIPLSNERTK